MKNKYICAYIDQKIQYLNAQAHRSFLNNGNSQNILVSDDYLVAIKFYFLSYVYYLKIQFVHSYWFIQPLKTQTTYYKFYNRKTLSYLNANLIFFKLFSFWDTIILIPIGYDVWRISQVNIYTNLALHCILEPSLRFGPFVTRVP